MSLQLVGYDLREPRRYGVLDDVLGNALKKRPGMFDGGINLPNGPRFVDAKATPKRVLDELVNPLDPEEFDRLIVLKLGKPWAGLHLPPKVTKWLEERMANEGLAREKDGWLGIAHTIRIPPGTSSRGRLALQMERRAADRRRRQLMLKIHALPRHNDALVRPVHALTFIKTDLTPEVVKARLRKVLSKHDELLVVRVDVSTRVEHKAA